jgi:hypothetical protein
LGQRTFDESLKLQVIQMVRLRDLPVNEVCGEIGSSPI